FANTDDEEQGSIGLGYRTMLNPQWILGVNGFFDILDSRYDNTFLQGGVGVEALSEDWDFRVNGHFPSGDPEDVEELGYDIIGIDVLMDTNRFGLRSYEERAMNGVEGEVGWKLPIFDSDPDFEIRIFGGGFYYWADNLQNVAGPRGRIEARIYDLDFLTDGSRLTLGGEVRNDDVRGTEGFGSVIVRIPLAAMGVGSQPKVTGLDRRMLDRIVREPIITGIGYNDEAVFINNGDARVDTIFFAENNGGGSGVKYDPTYLLRALNEGGDNSLVVLDGGNGAYTAGAGGINLADGQSLVGSAKEVKLTGSYSGYMVYFTPNPGGTKPTIIGTNVLTSLVKFEDNSSIVNLYLEGEFNHAVFGADVESNFWIQDLDIDLAGAGGQGIRVNVNNPRDNVYNLFTTSTPSGFINWNRLHDSTVHGGVRVEIYAADNAPHSFDLAATENTVTNVLREGIRVNIDGYNPGTSLKVSVDVSDNSISDVADDDGIEVNTRSYLGAFVDADDPISITGNTIHDIEETGIQLFTGADLEGTIVQTLSINNNTITDADDDGINVEVAARNGGLIDQANTINVNNNSIDETGGAGIDVFNGADLEGTIVQTLNINGNSIHNVDDFGIDVDNRVWHGSVIDQANTISINGNTVLDTGQDGIQVDNAAFHSGSSLIQTINVNNNSIDETSGDGIEVYTVAGKGGFVDQANTITINGNTVLNAGEDGIDVTTYAHSPGVPGTTIWQTINVNGNSINDVTWDGIDIDTDADRFAVIDQANTINVNDNIVLNAGAEGIEVETEVDRYATIIQTSNILRNSIDNTGDAGIKVSNEVDNGGVLDQSNTISI
ncbi:MAG: hypothetical protein GY791_01400, partial [Alphaproteobacteria bacterium]|nr:hypothetical protein [Alphaproteobacteria bacterium]